MDFGLLVRHLMHAYRFYAIEVFASKPKTNEWIRECARFGHSKSNCQVQFDAIADGWWPFILISWNSSAKMPRAQLTQALNTSLPFHSFCFILSTRWCIDFFPLNKQKKKRRKNTKNCKTKNVSLSKCAISICFKPQFSVATALHCVIRLNALNRSRSP